MRPVLAVGWDVGGWIGGKQAIAVATDGPRWLGSATTFRLAEFENPCGLEKLIQRAWPDAPPTVLSEFQCVVAVDAPLGFPKAFKDLLLERPIPAFPPDGPEILNPYA